MKDVNIVFILLALITEIIGTVGGFGSSVFFVPLGNFYFDFQSVLGLTALFHLSSNLSKIFLFKKGLDKRLLLTIGIPSVLFVIVGGVLSKHNIRVLQQWIHSQARFQICPLFVCNWSGRLIYWQKNIGPYPTKQISKTFIISNTLYRNGYADQVDIQMTMNFTALWQRSRHSALKQNAHETFVSKYMSRLALLKH